MKVLSKVIDFNRLSSFFNSRICVLSLLETNRKTGELVIFRFLLESKVNMSFAYQVQRIMAGLLRSWESLETRGMLDKTYGKKLGNCCILGACCREHDKHSM